MTLIFKKIMLNNKSISSDVNSYYEFWTFFSLLQSIKVPTRITCNSAAIIDQILASWPERVTQQDIIDVGLTDNKLIFCTRKISKIKRGTHKHIKFRLFRHYSADPFKETLVELLLNIKMLICYWSLWWLHSENYGCNW